MGDDTTLKQTADPEAEAIASGVRAPFIAACLFFLCVVATLPIMRIGGKHPLAPKAAETALEAGLSRPEAAGLDPQALREFVTTQLRPWKPEHVRVEATGYDGREVAVSALVQSASGGWFGLDRPEHGCLLAQIRGRSVGAWASYDNGDCTGSAASYSPIYGGPDAVLDQRLLDTKAAVVTALYSLDGPHPPLDRVTLRSALASATLPAHASLDLAPDGDAGISVWVGSQRCVLAWAGATGGVQVWALTTPWGGSGSCSPEAALKTVPGGSGGGR